MIGNFKTRALKRLYKEGDHSGIAPDHVARVGRILAHLDVSTKPKDMDLPGWRLHPLTGDRQGFWSVAVTGNRWIIFRFEDGDAAELDYLDYH